MPALRPLACLAILCVAGCVEAPGDGPSPTGGGSGTGLPSAAHSSEPPAKGGFRSLEKGWLSYVGSEGFDGRVLRDQASWDAFWAEHRSGHSEPGEPPAVDFATELAIAVIRASQSSGGHAIEVTDVTAQGDGLVVRYATDSPGAGCGSGAVMTRPFHLVAAKAPADASVEFELVEERVNDCEVAQPYL